ncbi:DegV family protein [Olsenella sp. YH-ols2217]|uniref:DegV family protein n=1 Tax=Kribbibacterium absianum TaxID=3044210 RepID=A0ABT6ZJM7_9ACTN|nr:MULTISPECIES: DegV family protein [unclassified Olsenella]MDJ1122759.1 DegV family protein [Olsenella sp. YH-ols2216]MDJ1129258.1 DegV family protein [Olsenella sp. YH-ols2217]
MFALVTDAASGLPMDWCASHDVQLVALTRAGSGKRVRVGAPAVEDYKILFAHLLREGREVLCVTASSALSRSHSHALEAAEDLDGVTVVDSKCTSAGEALLVQVLASGNVAGMDREDAASYASALVGHLTMLTLAPPGGGTGHKRSLVAAAQATLAKRHGFSTLMTFDEAGALVSAGRFADPSVAAGRVSRLMRLDRERDGRLLILGTYVDTPRSLAVLGRQEDDVERLLNERRALPLTGALAAAAGAGSASVAYVAMKYVTGPLAEDPAWGVGCVLGH